MREHGYKKIRGKVRENSIHNTAQDYQCGQGMHEGPVRPVLSKGAHTKEQQKTYGESVYAALFLKTVSDSHIPFPLGKEQSGDDQ